MQKRRNSITTRALQPPPASRIKKSVLALVLAMVNDYEESIKTLFTGNRRTILDAVINETFAASAGLLLDELAYKYERLFYFASIEWSNRIVNEATVASKVQLDYALSKLVQDVTIQPLQLQSGVLKESLTAITTEAAGLFKTIAPIYHDKVQKTVMEAIANGQGFADMKPFFEAHSNGTRNYAELRTMDQSRKAFNGIAKARMINAGIKQFEWMHTHSSREPRKLHQQLDGKIFSFDDPPYIGDMYGVPVYGTPGVMINCRCLLKPVLLEIK
jgi:SPP1 gp7 family putative phage head morphogenesis protein